jgi:ATP-dependent Clp protease adapter protein ClpS
MADPFEPQDAGRPDSPQQPVTTLPRWRVSLHDDEVHDRQYVIDVLAEHMPLSHAAATQRVLQAHTHGTAVLLHTHRELAELYYVQLSKQDLIVTIEQAQA